MFKTDDLIALLCVDGLGPRTIYSLTEIFNEPEVILKADFNTLKHAGVNDVIASQITDHSYQECLDTQLKFISDHQVKVLSRWDKEYPEPLKHIFDPPVLLFYFGEFSPDDEYSLAIVGSRHPDSYGKQVTQKIAADIAAKGITIVSGLARGVDSLAHYAAVNNHSRTIAVLGTSIDTVYPAENRSLANSIVKNGVVMSEYLVGKKHVPANFVRRNRMISGLSRGVIVTQAGDDSGAIITAMNANEQNREVFAIPGDIQKGKHAGCHRLLKTGAKLVEKFEDILDELPILKERLSSQTNWVTESARLIELNQPETELINCLSKDACHIDALSEKCQLGRGDLMTALLNLELKGYIKQLPGKYFVRQI